MSEETVTTNDLNGLMREASDLLLSYDEPSLEGGAIGLLYRILESWKANNYDE